MLPSRLSVLLILCLSSAANAAATRLEAIPYPLTASVERGSLASTPATLTLSAGKGTDLYTNADGSKVADQTPRVLFAPAGDFIFSARVEASFNQPFDGAALIVYGARGTWAKLLFEFGRDGKTGVSSTVAKGVGDDAHHGAREGSTLFLKIARRQDLYVFYTSSDGLRWNMVRNFGLPSSAPVQIGFSAQSPLGEQFSAQFSSIRFRPDAFKDFWQGE